MKNYIIATIAACIFMVTGAWASKPEMATAVSAQHYKVYSEKGQVIIQNLGDKQFTVTVATQGGKKVTRTTTDNRTKNISLSKLQQGKYNLSIQSADGINQNVKLIVL